jgi:hypothetical protein
MAVSKCINCKSLVLFGCNSIWDMAIAKFAYADFIAFIECVENVVLLLAVTVWLQGLRVHKSNILHGVTNVFNIYSNICNIDSYFVYKLSIKWIDNFRCIFRCYMICQSSSLIIAKCKVGGRAFWHDFHQTFVLRLPPANCRASKTKVCIQATFYSLYRIKNTMKKLQQLVYS